MRKYTNITLAILAVTFIPTTLVAIFLDSEFTKELARQGKFGKTRSQKISTVVLIVIALVVDIIKLIFIIK